MNLIRPMLGWLSSCLFLKPPLWAESYWWLGRFVSFDSLMATMTTSSQDVWNCLDSAELPCILRHLWTAVFSVRFSGWCPANWRGLVVWCCFDKRKFRPAGAIFDGVSWIFGSVASDQGSSHQPINPSMWISWRAIQLCDSRDQLQLQLIQNARHHFASSPGNGKCESSLKHVAIQLFDFPKNEHAPLFHVWLERIFFMSVLSRD